ncbi:hypothetical protein RSAG8_04017, partial [Rhizoctonia solani AG-8 WAC10335]
MSNPGCVICEARNKKCDQTRGSNGCRRCAKAGLECEGYLAPRIPKSMRSIWDNGPPLRITSVRPTHLGSSAPDLVTHKSTEYFNPSAILNDASRSGGNSFTASPDRSDFPTGVPTPEQSIYRRSQASVPYEQVPTPPTEDVTAPPLGQIPSLHMGDVFPIEGAPLPPIDGPITPARSKSSDLVLSLADEPKTLLWAPQSPGSLTRSLRTTSGQTSASQLQVDRPAYANDDAQPEGPENLQVELLNGLVLDRKVESNMVSFLVHSFTSWMSRFLFEPLRVIPLFRESIVRGHSYGHEAHQRMVLIANSVLNVSESTDYDLAPFTVLYNQLIKGVVDARARGSLTREAAVEAMQFCHEVVSIMCKVCSLASILNTMNLCAPVFRRACPESGAELVNLPRILTSFDVHLKLYATMDVLLSAITSRPMYFRYDLEFPSWMVEEFLNADDVPGLRWLIGVPDRLIVTLARMNTFGGL